jgi:hypothetical protein
MSKKFQYQNGFIGVVSDAVAPILEKKGEGKVVPGIPEPPKKFEPKGEKKGDE